MRGDSDFGFSVAYAAIAHAIVLALFLYLIFLNHEEDLPLVMAPEKSAASIDWQDSADFLPDSVPDLPEEIEELLDSPVRRELPTLNSARPMDDPESRIALPLPPPDLVAEPEPEPIPEPEVVLIPKPTPKPKPVVKKKVPKKVEPKPKLKPKPVVKKTVQKTIPKPKPKKVDPPKPKPKKADPPKPAPKPKTVAKKPAPKVPVKTVAKKPAAKPAPKVNAKPAPRRAEPVSVAKKVTSTVAPKRAVPVGSVLGSAPVGPPRAQRVGGSSTSSSSKVDTGWYDQLIKRTFEGNWREPRLTTGQKIYAKVRITVAPDGRVIKAIFEKQSGMRAMDDSVVEALKATKRIPRPLPGDLAGENYSFLFTFKLTPTPNAR